MKPAALGLAAIGLAVLGLLLTAITAPLVADEGTATVVLLALTGLSAVGVGAAAALRRTGTNFGLLLAGAGCLWFVIQWDTTDVGSAVLFTLGLAGSGAFPPSRPILPSPIPPVISPLAVTGSPSPRDMLSWWGFSAWPRRSYSTRPPPVARHARTICSNLGRRRQLSSRCVARPRHALR